MAEKLFKRHTITSALPYANGPIHIGHLAGVYVPADIYVRYLRSKEEDVLFDGKGGCFIESGRDTASLIQVDMFSESGPSTHLTDSTSENLNEKVQFEKERLSKWL